MKQVTKFTTDHQTRCVSLLLLMMMVSSTPIHVTRLNTRTQYLSGRLLAWITEPVADLIGDINTNDSQVLYSI